MRVERDRLDSRDARSGAVRSSVDLAACFSTALRRFQGAERSAQDGTRRVHEPSARDQKRRSDHTEGVRDGGGFVHEFAEGSAGEAVLSLPAAFLLVPQAIDVMAEGVAHGAAAREARRRRAVAEHELFLDEKFPCVEVEHAASGLRCLLSRQDGVWLLSVTQSPASDEDANALIDGLRAHFQMQGLGPIDVVF